MQELKKTSLVIANKLINTIKKVLQNNKKKVA